MSEELDIWYEEELLPAEAVVKENATTLSLNTAVSHVQAEHEVRAVAKGILRVDKPRWIPLDPTEYKLLPSGGDARFYFVRLGFQFDLTEEGRKEYAQFIYARCEAYIWPAAGSVQPIIYELLPRDLYEGESRQVHVELGPEIKLGEAGGSLGKISTDFAVGRVEPVIVGFPGEHERAPYWDLRPNSKTLLGVRHLWLIIEAPKGCDGVRLTARAYGDIQTTWGRIPLGLPTRESDSRPSIVIR